MIQALILTLVLFFGNAGQTDQTEKPYMVIYDIHDLEMTHPDFADAPEMDLSAALQGNGQNVFRSAPQTSPLGKPKDGQEIIELITSTVEPEAWGFEATIRYFRGSLIVTAPKRIHDQIH